MVEKLLEELENALDPEVEEALWNDWVTFAEGRYAGDVFSSGRQRACCGKLDWPTVSVNETLDDEDAMVLQQFGMCAQNLAAGNGNILCVRANYGTSIVPSLFGVRPFRMADELDTLPTSWPLENEEAISAAVAAGVPDIHGGYTEQVLATGRRFKEIQAQYPKIGRYVHIYHPDLQGPLDVCELLWGSGLMTAFYEQPDQVHALLRVITETYIALMNTWAETVPPEDSDLTVHWSMMHRGRIMLRNDSAMNLSPALYDEFAKPYDARLLEVFGGGCVHFCGRGDHYIASLSEIPGVYAVNLSQPEYNDMEAVFRHTVDRGIAIIGLDWEAAQTATARGRALHGRVHAARDAGY